MSLHSNISLLDNLAHLYISTFTYTTLNLCSFTISIFLQQEALTD